MPIINRLITPHLKRLATQYPVVTLTGPRQSGKTTVCRETFEEDYDYCNLEDLESRQFAIEDPKGFLAQFTKKGVILDEIQRVPEIVSYIQVIVDEKQIAGQFILTGSEQFEVSKSINQSLAGRTAILRLLPLALEEIYPQAKSVPSIENLMYKGFYPRIHDKKLNPTEALSFYLSTYVERDVRRLTSIKDLAQFDRFLKLCATQIGQLLNYSTLANDCGVDQNTIKAWLSILEACYTVYRLPPHFKNFRKRLTKSPKLYFYDVGLATYLLGINQPEHISAHPLKGSLFENFVVTEFLKHRYNSVQDNNLYFFRDHVGNEVDLIQDFGQKQIAIEIKSSKTLKTSLLQGLEYYKNLSSEDTMNTFLIYGGDKVTTMQNTQVLPYTNLPELWQK